MRGGFLTVMLFATLSGAPAFVIGANNAISTPTIESAFSPDQGAEKLVSKNIASAERSLRVAAYSFTSPTIAKALIAAKRRGVDVKVLVDDKRNQGKSSIAALNLLVKADIPTRTISTYAMHHDKYIISDSTHVQTGSFNYSPTAATSNSENVLVIWNDPHLAAAYTNHWNSRWDQGTQVQAVTSNHDIRHQTP